MEIWGLSGYTLVLVVADGFRDFRRNIFGI